MITIPAVLAPDPIEVPLIDDALDNLLGILSDIMKILFHPIIFHCVNVISVIFDIYSLGEIRMVVKLYKRVVKVPMQCTYIKN